MQATFFKQEEHPLLNSLVLDALFSYDTTINSLRRNRLVSRCWMEACAKNWDKQEKHPVLQYSGDNARALVTLEEFQGLYQARHKEVKQVVECPNPALKLTLFSWQYRDQTLLLNSFSLDQWFWGTFANSLKRLTLMECDFQEQVWVFQESFLKRLPNLEELTIKDCVVQRQALEHINQAYQRWMEYEGRENWQEALRRRRPLPYFEGGYQHESLQSLEVSLRVAPGLGIDGLPPPLQIWGPLLSLLPKLKILRVGGYQLPECPPLKLKRLGGEDDPKIIKVRKFMQEFPYHRGNETVIVNYKRDRSSWMGRGSFHWLVGDPSLPAPNHRGYFSELFWGYEVGLVGMSLEQLNLLDFSVQAQEFGVLSTVEVAAPIKNLNGQANLFRFNKLEQVALDLGLDPLFAARDMEALQRWTIREVLQKMVLYRAPFHPGELPIHALYVLLRKRELEIWGNVSHNLEFIRYNRNLERFTWNTSCYEEKYHGKRVHSLLKEGRKAYPIFKEDLVEKTKWEWDRQNLPPAGWMEGQWLFQVKQLEMDFGPLLLKSWTRLGEECPNLRWLKGVVVGDNQLERLVDCWPELEMLEFAHRSFVSAQGIVKNLVRFAELKGFKWKGCACTFKLFGLEEQGKIEAIRELGAALKRQLCAKLELPWDKDVDWYCIQAEFEAALLTGESSKFFQVLEQVKI